MSFRFPYLAIDVETTGLDTQKAHVLQLAAIYDTGKPLEKLPVFNQVIRWPVISYATEFAMQLNKHLVEQAFKKKDVVFIEEARELFEKFVTANSHERSITLAGKNVAGFDIPIMANKFNGFNMRRFKRRVLDPGSMFSNQFDHIPDQTEINTILGRKEVTHDALDDCWDVVHAVREFWEADH